MPQATNDQAFDARAGDPRAEARPAPEQVRKVWITADRIARVSDRIVGVGPFNFGLDALFALIPVAGPTYTIGVGAYLIYLAKLAEASPATMAKMAAYVGVDTVLSGVPIAGPVVDILFPGHVMAAKSLRADIERRYGPMAEPPRRGFGRFGWSGRTPSGRSASA